jgi:4-azaleucine resistance transporter AzlC
MTRTQPADTALRAARRRLLLDTLGIAVSVAGFGFVFGLAARNAGYSPVEALAMSTIAFAGAAQFAAVGYVAAGLPWPGIVLLTALLNARHLLYSAALAPRLRGVSLAHRAALAHVLTDEAFALAAAHFHRLGRADVGGYWIGAVVGVFIPWNLATIGGVLAGGAIPDPTRFGLDIVFPAAMAGLAVGLVTGRREIVAAGSGGVIGVLLSLAIGPALGVVAGGLVGPLLGMALPDGGPHATPDSDVTGLRVDLDGALAEAAEDAEAAGDPGGEPAATGPGGRPATADAR